MAALRLRGRRVYALKPRKSAFDVRDRDFKGFYTVVINAAEGHVVLAYPDGRERQIDSFGYIRYRLDLFETQPLVLRAGDRMRWTEAPLTRAMPSAAPSAVRAIKTTHRSKHRSTSGVTSVRPFPDRFCRLNPFSTAAACAESA